MARFCGECGSPVVAGTARFCQECGAPLAQPAAPAAPVTSAPPLAAPAPLVAAPAGGGGAAARRRGPWIAAALGVVVVAGGATAAGLLLTGGDGGTVGSSSGRPARELVAPLEGEPEEAWRWQAPGAVDSNLVVGDVTVFGSVEAGEVTALDAEGRPLWSTDDASGSYATAASADEEVVFVSPWEDVGLTAISVDDGRVIWDDPSGYFAGTAGDVVVLGDDDGLRGVDLGSGRDLWSVDTTSSSSVTDQALLTYDEGEVAAHSLADGRLLWQRDLRDIESDDVYATMGTNGDMVVIAGLEVVALDVGDGTELWRTPSAGDSASVGAFSEDAVWVGVSDYDEVSEVTTTTATVYDRSGAVGDLDVDDDAGYVDLTAFRTGGEAYAYDAVTGRVYDETLDPIGRYPGTLAVAEGGIYAVEEGRIAFFELGANAATWELTTAADYVQAAPAPGRVLVWADDEVTAYR